MHKIRTLFEENDVRMWVLPVICYVCKGCREEQPEIYKTKQDFLNSQKNAQKTTEIV